MKSALLLAAFALISCSEKEEDEFAVPAVSASCASPATACADDSADGKNFIIYWSTAICIDSDSAEEIKAGNAAATTCSDGTCTASIGSWFDYNGAAISKIKKGTYFLCAGIDLDDDGYLNTAGEPVAVKAGVELKKGTAAQEFTDFEDQT